MDEAIVQRLRALEQKPFDLYLHNPFRWAGAARTDLDLTQIRTLLDNNRQGMPGPGGAFGRALGAGLLPALTAGAVTATVQLLNQNRLHRLIVELFWFWPCRADDPAVEALSDGNAAAARAAWQAPAPDREAASIARHNLAVLGHLEALDDYVHARNSKTAEPDGRAFGSAREALKRAMEQALASWQGVIADNLFWDAVVVRRAARLDSDALPPERVQAVRAALPGFLMGSVLHLAREFAMRGLRRLAEAGGPAEAGGAGPPHEYNARGICRRCGLGKRSAEYFGWRCSAGPMRREMRELAYAQDLVAAAGVTVPDGGAAWERLLRQDRDDLHREIGAIHTAATQAGYDPERFERTSLDEVRTRLAAIALLTAGDAAQREQYIGGLGQPAYNLASWFATAGRPTSPAAAEVIKRELSLPLTEEWRRKIWTDYLGQAGAPPPPPLPPADLFLEDEPLQAEAEALTRTLAPLFVAGLRVDAFVAGLDGEDRLARLRDLRRQVLALDDPRHAEQALDALLRFVERAAEIAGTATAEGDIDIAHGLLQLAKELCGGLPMAGAAERRIAERQSELDKFIAPAAICFFCPRPAPQDNNRLTLTVRRPAGAPAVPPLATPEQFKIVLARCNDCAGKHQFGWLVLAGLIGVLALWLGGQFDEWQSVVFLLVVAAFAFALGKWRRIVHRFFAIWGCLAASGRKHRLQAAEHPACKRLVARGWRVNWPD